MMLQDYNVIPSDKLLGSKYNKIDRNEFQIQIITKEESDKGKIIDIITLQLDDKTQSRKLAINNDFIYALNKLGNQAFDLTKVEVGFKFSGIFIRNSSYTFNMELKLDKIIVYKNDVELNNLSTELESIKKSINASIPATLRNLKSISYDLFDTLEIPMDMYIMHILEISVLVVTPRRSFYGSEGRFPPINGRIILMQMIK